jgi:hypothetical protein
MIERRFATMNGFASGVSLQMQRFETARIISPSSLAD